MAGQSYFKVRQESGKTLGELVPLRSADLTGHFPEKAEGKTRIILSETDREGKTSHYLVKSCSVPQDNKLTIDAKAGRLKRLGGDAEMPEFLMISEGKIHLLQVEPYTDYDIPARKLDNTDKTQLSEMRDEVCRLAELTRQIELIERASESKEKYTRPRINVDAIRHALTPYSSSETANSVADRVRNLDHHSAGFIHANMLAHGLKLPDELHEAILVRLGKGRYRGISDRVAAGLFTRWGREYVCPLESEYSNKDAYLGKLWASAAVAANHIQRKEHELAEEKILKGIAHTIKDLEPKRGEAYGNSLVMTDEGLQNQDMSDSPATERRKEILQSEFRKMADNPKAIVTMLEQSLQSTEIARQAGPEFHQAFEKWLPIFLSGVNGLQSSEQLSFEAKMRDTHIMEGNISKGTNDTVIKNIVRRQVEAVGAAIRERATDQQIKLMLGTNMSSALCWTHPLQENQDETDPLWKKSHDDMMTLTEPENQETLIKALKKLV